MQLQTHVLSGWCLANLCGLSKRERLFGMLAASLADLDSLSRLFGQEAYWDYHHVLTHNLFFGIALAVILTCFSQQRCKACVLYLALFHLHLLLDYYGSGPGWGLAYVWPVSDWPIVNPDAWPFEAWQNIVVGCICIGWTVMIVLINHRTPLELLKSSLDRQLVDLAHTLQRKVWRA